MPHELTWDTAEDIGIELSEKFPDLNHSKSVSLTCIVT